jgi:hypothetical protein
MNKIYIVCGDKISNSLPPGFSQNVKIIDKSVIRGFYSFVKAAEFVDSQLNDDTNKDIYQVYTKFKNGFDNMYIEVIEID